VKAVARSERPLEGVREMSGSSPDADAIQRAAPVG
jgi:hypothetical protein